MDTDDPQQRLLRAAAEREEAEAEGRAVDDAEFEVIALRLRLPQPAKRIFFCGAALVTLLVAFSTCWAATRATSSAAQGVGIAETNAQRVLQLNYVSFHPFNLIYRLSAQTLFGLPGETTSRIPMLFSNFQLEVVLRTLDDSAATITTGNGSCSGAALTAPTVTKPRPGTSDAALLQESDQFRASTNAMDVAGFLTTQPASAALVAAGLLTMPRAALLVAWWRSGDLASNGVSALSAMRNTRVNLLTAADKLTFGRLRALGLHTPGSEATEELPASPSGLSGLCFWALAFLCPSALTCYLAMGLAATAPLTAAWAMLASLTRGACELRVAAHLVALVWRRQPQAALQCMACSHGVPTVLGCHMLGGLWLAAALLPGRVLLCLAVYLYGLWAPLAAAAIMLMALRPNQGGLLQVGGLHRHHHHHQGQNPHGDGDFAVEGGADGGAGPPHVAGTGVTASVEVRRRQHWPPPVEVPAALQEEAEHAPRHLLCPITHLILTEPAVTVTGATYERSAIIGWLQQAGKDPLTGHAVSPDEVFPNLAMYAVLEEYVREKQ
ncbi:hypothetical protein HYH02_004608 [Chlamydomonas schloesseri]|uniref:U-box domain-containing protein n=1 Tax=Chlamydomonas schloesseri TaxID=2026947 RepID=A0A836B8C7_9CHLO|nr:hypothetical protein HYH02_004608 [Chlamydomonas schloesseri]|eukprot:KAG2450771.1 hypothetical protein HYH02_004608 [Chlamydomonas schloesseri]